MYRIMIARNKAANYASLYQFLTTTTDGVISPVELADKQALDAKIEKMLNEDGYSKSDFIVVEVVDYTIDATGYSDDDTETEPETDTGTDAGTENGEN